MPTPSNNDLTWDSLEAAHGVSGASPAGSWDSLQASYGIGGPAPTWGNVKQTIEAPAKERKGLIGELGDTIGQFVSDTAKAPITFNQETDRNIPAWGNLIKATGFSNAAQLWMQAFRARIGFPVSPEEQQSLAESVRAYKLAHPNDPEIKKAEENLKSVTSLTPEEQKSFARGVGNIASIAAGGPIGKGAGFAAEKLIPNLLARRIAAIEAHSIAQMVTFDVTNSIAEDKPVTPGGLAASAGLGAALPGLGKVAGGAAGLLVKGGVAGTKAVAGAVGEGVERAIGQTKVYNAVRNLISDVNDGVLINGEMLLRKYGMGDTADKLVQVRGTRHLLGATWNTRVARAMVDLSQDDRNLVGTLLHEDDPIKRAAILARAENPQATETAMNEVGSVLKRVGSLAQNAAIVVGDSHGGDLYRFVPRKDFGMPHVFVDTAQFMEPGALRDEALGNIKAVLKKEGWKPQVPNQTIDDAASDILERIHLRASGEYEEAVRKFGTKFSGTVQVYGRHYNLPGYHLDPADVLPMYLERMSRNIVQAVEFGTPADVKLAGKSLKDIYPGAFAELDKITDPDTRNRVEAVITRQLGSGFKNPSPKRGRIINALLQYQAIDKLGLAQIAQTAQLLTPNLQTGFRGAMQDFFRLMAKDPALQDQMLRTGAFTQALVREAEDRMYGGGKGGGILDVAKVLKRTGFTGLDTLARKYGVLRGFSFAEYQADQFFNLWQRLPKAKGLEANYIKNQMAKIESKLVDLGVDTQGLVKRGGILAPEDYLKAGQKMSTDWNFWGDSMSLPAFWNSPSGRVLTQFKSFAYQQTVALKKHVVRPALEGDLGPLARLLVAGQFSGDLINDARAMARGKPRNEQTRIWDNYAALGLLSMWGDTMQASEKKDWLSGFLAGPTGSDLMEGMVSVSDAMHGKSKRLTKYAINHAGPLVPVVGPLLTPAVVNSIYPPKEPKQ